MSEAPAQPTTSARLSNISTLVVLPFVTAILGGGVGSLLTYWTANREMDVKMVEIAVGILSQPPNEGIAPAREWAVDVINGFSEVPISDRVRKALLENRIDLRRSAVEAAEAYIAGCESNPDGCALAPKATGQGEKAN